MVLGLVFCVYEKEEEEEEEKEEALQEEEEEKEEEGASGRCLILKIPNASIRTVPVPVPVSVLCQTQTQTHTARVGCRVGVMCDVHIAALVLVLVLDTVLVS